VRPDHLFLGTPYDNTHDAMNKGRLRIAGLLGRRGAEVHSAKLTPDVVAAARQARAGGARFNEIAAKAGVSREIARRAVRGESWGNDGAIPADDFRAMRGETHPGARLTESGVREIRRLNEAGVPKLHIAEHMGVSRRLVQLVLAGKAWAHVPHGDTADAASPIATPTTSPPIPKP
jgi:hypothetical protein